MLRISAVSFPGFNIDKFELNSVAIKIGDFEIAWYALIITLGMVAAILYAISQTKKIGLTTDELLDFAIITIPMGIVGTRLYYVLSKPEEFDTFYDVINIRNGGLAIYGGLIAGAITVFIICCVKKIKFLAFADCAMPGIMLAQGIGRWGNFMNGEAFGAETDIFCRMGINNVLTMNRMIYVHPTFLYESLWCIGGFLLIFFLIRRFKKYDGQIFFVTCGWYGFGRMLIEGLRADSLYTYIGDLSFRTSQVLAGAIFLTCAALLIYFHFKKPTSPFYHKSNPTNKK